MENQQPAGEAQKKQKPFYKKWWFITIAVVIVLSAIIGSSEEKKDEEKTAQEQTAVNENVVAKQEEAKNETKQETAISEVKSEDVAKLPKYEIVYEVKNKRYDGGVNYYILINPVNLANDSFKNDIKAIIKQIVKEKGAKISIDFVDDKNMLDLEYKSHYGANTLGRILTKQETDQLGLHLIAMFSGELQTDPDFNSLSFFPGAFTDNQKVGKYVENMKFDPGK